MLKDLKSRIEMFWVQGFQHLVFKGCKDLFEGFGV